MKKITLIFLILMIFLSLATSGCNVSEIIDSAIVCKEPYIRFETGCCLDKDRNDICDDDEEDKSYDYSYCGGSYCTESWIGDGYCDTVCYNEDCEWDGGDCDDQCNAGCSENSIGDEYCDSECYNEECRWDEGDCEGQCNAGCPDDFINDGYCDVDCFVEACDYDGGDCEDYCAIGCLDSWLGDGYCDFACNVETCNYDEGDC